MDVKLLLNSVQKNSKAIIAIALFCCFSSIFGQARYEIAFGEKININVTDFNSRFTISGPTGEIHLDGAAINQYTFQKPGNYTIKVAQSHNHSKECNHLPQETTVKVHSVRMRFDARNLSLSAPIQKNKETDKIVVSIPVSIESYDHRAVKLNLATVKSAGIGSSIVAIPDTSLSELPEGKHTLRYTLQGIATQNTYLMLDLVDANGLVQSIALPSPITD